MFDGNLPCDPATEGPARSRLVTRAWGLRSRAVRGRARWCRWNWHRSLPGWRAALIHTLRGPYDCYGLSGRSAPGRCTPLSSPPAATTSPRKSGWVNHVAVAALILASGHAAAYHDHIWCTGGTKFDDMSECIEWEDSHKFDYSARNTCSMYLKLTVCWTSHSVPGTDMVHEINFRCDKSHPIPPAPWGGLEPGESGLVPKGEFVWWAWRCEE